MHQLRTIAIGAALAAGLMGSAQQVAAAQKGNAAKGKEVFEQCAVCHNADSDEKKMGPGLKGLFKRDKMVNGKKPTEGNVLEKINEGGNGMPSYKDMLSDQEKADLIAYLKTL
jgi:cytochrome c2